MTYISNSEKCKRITKYILMGLVTTCSLRYIPNTLLSTRELIMISFISSISFAILDMTSPSMVIDSSSKPDSQKIAIVHNDSTELTPELPVDSTIKDQILDQPVEDYDDTPQSASV